MVVQRDWRLGLGEYADAALPRPVDPDRPQLVLGWCEGDPLEYIERLNKGKVPYQSAFAVGHGIKPRMNLLESLPDHLTSETKTFKEQSGAVNDYLVNQLGYVVDRNWGNVIYTVYVIDLSDDVPKARVGPNGWIYVGQTVLTREERYQEHVDGDKANNWVTKHHLRLNEELCDRYPQVRTRVEAMALEERAAAELEEEGWSVKWG